ncbi:MAG: membrane protein insertion efficiency factor YidD [Phycisphaerae bacterium]
MTIPSHIMATMHSADRPHPDLARGRAVAPAIARGMTSLAAFCLIVLVRGYQVGLRPLLIGSCKYCPTCSEYFIEAVRRYGPWRGGLLGLRRLARCHPFGPGGIDPVP